MPKELSNHVSKTLDDLNREKMARNPFNGLETHRNIHAGEKAEKEARDDEEADHLWELDDEKKLKTVLEQKRKAKEDKEKQDAEQKQKAQEEEGRDKMQE